MVAVLTDDGSRYVCVATLQGHQAYALNVALSPVGNRVVGGYRKPSLLAWYPGIDQCSHIWITHPYGVSDLAFDSTGDILASSGIQHHVVHLHNMNAGTSRMIEAFNVVWSLAFSCFGLLAIGTEQEIEVWDASISKRMFLLKGHQGWIRTLAFSPKGLGLISGSSDGTARAWDVASGQEVFRTSNHGGQEVTSVALSPDGFTMVCSIEDGSVELWDLHHGRLSGALATDRSTDCVAVNPKDSTIATGDRDGRVRIWDPVTGQLRQTLLGHHKFINQVTFSADGTIMASASADRTIRLWRREEDVLRQQLVGQASPLNRPKWLG